MKIWCRYIVGRKKKKKRIYLFQYKLSYNEVKLVPVIIDYRLLQFDTSKFFSGVHLHGGCLPNFNFFNVNPQRNNDKRINIFKYGHYLVSLEYLK